MADLTQTADFHVVTGIMMHTTDVSENIVSGFIFRIETITSNRDKYATRRGGWL